MIRASLVFSALVGAVLAKDGKCAVGEKGKYTTTGAAVSLLAAAPAAEAWGNEAGEGLQELSTMAEVDQVVSGTPCVIMFYAEWCPHCKRMKPIYTQVAQHVAAEHFTKDIGVKFFMVNADAYRDIGGAYGVNGYPTIKYFSGQGLDRVGKEYEGGESDPPERLENFAKDEHMKAGGSAGVVLAANKAGTADPNVVPENCDAASCDGLACPEGWTTAINTACACKCVRDKAAKAVKAKAKARSRH